MIRQYNGPLGRFDYDDTLFTTMKSNETNPRFATEFLHYEGKETDGSKIKLPEGLLDASNVFAGTNLESVVVIPDGVVSTCGMYAGCRNLQHGDNFVPDSVTDQSFMYDDCVSLKTPGKISNNAVYLTGTYNGCTVLSSVPSIPDSVKDMESFCANSGVTQPFTGGKNVENAYGAFAFCEQLQGMPVDINPQANMEDMVTGCSQLVSVEEVSSEKKLSLAERYQQMQPVAFDSIDFDNEELGIDREEKASTNIDLFVESNKEADAKTAARSAGLDFIDNQNQNQIDGLGFQ